LEKREIVQPPKAEKFENRLLGPTE
jgi:hypothetical protein